mmetsp:Transcript_41532/g.81459  ORF Transcript_41532/g.81459 Transcript_41532/m.81459 type:complete len:188 (-) Transcript_41532:1298-1861(-)
MVPFSSVPSESIMPPALNHLASLGIAPPLGMQRSGSFGLIPIQIHRTMTDTPVYDLEGGLPDLNEWDQGAVHSSEEGEVETILSVRTKLGFPSFDKDGNLKGFFQQFGDDKQLCFTSVQQYQKNWPDNLPMDELKDLTSRYANGEIEDRYVVKKSTHVTLEKMKLEVQLSEYVRQSSVKSEDQGDKA